MIKLLFLDIDGVLNGHEKLPGSVYCGIRPDQMAQLNRIIAETGCRLVISSAWRYMVLGGQMTEKGFQHLLQTHGLVCPEGEQVVVGTTVADEEIDDRGAQILSCVAGWPSRLMGWAVVDDDPMGMVLGHHEWRLVRTRGDVGLTAEGADRAIEILNGGTVRCTISCSFC